MLYCLQFKRLNEREMCMEPNEKIFTLAENFSASAKILTAIGDETRQHLILEMMKMGNCMGVRVGDITKKTNLSRPAVSHHLQIMKDAGIVKVRKEGTKNYYYFCSFYNLINCNNRYFYVAKQPNSCIRVQACL